MFHFQASQHECSVYDCNNTVISSKHAFAVYNFKWLGHCCVREFFFKNGKIIQKIYMPSSKAGEGNFHVLINSNSYYQLYVFNCISVLFLWWTDDLQVNLPARWGPLEGERLNPNVNTDHLSDNLLYSLILMCQICVRLGIWPISPPPQTICVDTWKYKKMHHNSIDFQNCIYYKLILGFFSRYL